MQEILSHRLPKFTNKEVKMVKGSMDFVGVNQCTAYYMYDARQGKPKVLGYQQDWNASFACVDDPGNVTLAKGLHDTTRINYYKAYITQLKRAIDDGANVEGYFAWSLLDNFEWRLGYTSSYSLMFALGMFCCWEAAYVSSVAVSGVLVDWLKDKIDISSLFARDGDYDLASVGCWISIEVFALISPFFCRASMLLFCMKT